MVEKFKVHMYANKVKFLRKKCKFACLQNKEILIRSSLLIASLWLQTDFIHSESSTVFAESTLASKLSFVLVSSSRDLVIPEIFWIKLFKWQLNKMLQKKLIKGFNFKLGYLILFIFNLTK